MLGEIDNMYTPQKTIVTCIDDYVTAIFQHAPYADAGRSHPQDVKNKACTLIPNIKHIPFTNRVIAAGIVYCSFILCDSRLSQKEISLVSKRSTRLKYIAPLSISKAGNYIRSFNELDIVW